MAEPRLSIQRSTVLLGRTGQRIFAARRWAGGVVEFIALCLFVFWVFLLLAFAASNAYAAPPPWAPAHGWRAKQVSLDCSKPVPFKPACHVRLLGPPVHP